MPTEIPLSRKEEERLWILSIVPLIPVMICIIAYFAHLKSIGVIPSDQVLFFYVILLGVVSLAAGAGIYEIASSFKARRPLSFRVRRYMLRIAFSSTYFLGIYVFWNLFTASLSSVLKEECIVILSLLTATLVMGVLVSRPRMRQFVKKLTQEESQP